jgi:DNA-binding transcriptional ArsR family regulator
MASVLPLRRRLTPSAVLKEAGLVLDRQEGTRRYYRLNPDGVGDLRAYFDRFWDRSLAAFKAAAEGKGSAS